MSIAAVAVPSSTSLVDSECARALARGRHDRRFVVADRRTAVLGHCDGVRPLGDRRLRRHDEVAGQVDERVPADVDLVVIAQEVLGDRLAVDERAVGAAEVLEERVVEDRHDRGMLAAHRGIRQADVVVGAAADRHALRSSGISRRRAVGKAEHELAHRHVVSSAALFFFARQRCAQPDVGRNSGGTRTRITEMLSRPPFWFARSTSSAAACGSSLALLVDDRVHDLADRPCRSGRPSTAGRCRWPRAGTRRCRPERSPRCRARA